MIEITIGVSSVGDQVGVRLKSEAKKPTPEEKLAASAIFKLTHTMLSEFVSEMSKQSGNPAMIISAPKESKAADGLIKRFGL